MPPPTAVNYLGQPITPGQVPQDNRTPSGQVSGSDMSALLNLLHESMQQQGQQSADRSSLQRGVIFGRHLGTGGGEITPDNPTGNAGNPWASNGLFHGGLAAQMSPEAVAASQGSTAVNQWNGLAAGNTPPGGSREGAAVFASPEPFHISDADRSRIGLPAAEPTLRDFYHTVPTNDFPMPNIQKLKPTAPPRGFGASGSPKPGFRF